MPYETDSPLSIDSNRVLRFPIASQCFQLISRRRSQNAQLRRSMKLEQFSQGDPLDGTERPAVVIVKELLSFLGAKALNHTHRILRHTLYVKQRMPPRAPRAPAAIADRTLRLIASPLPRSSNWQRRSSCLLFQALAVESCSFLPDDQRDRSNLPRQA
jgi:hypothetical protein